MHLSKSDTAISPSSCLLYWQSTWRFYDAKVKLKKNTFCQSVCHNFLIQLLFFFVKQTSSNQCAIMQFQFTYCLWLILFWYFWTSNTGFEHLCPLLLFAMLTLFWYFDLWLTTREMDFELDKLDKIENNNYSVENEYSLLQSRLTVNENYDSSAR